jgi:Bacterial archaeo-eukaryotic release factor family 5
VIAERRALLEELHGWDPPDGVLSVFFEIDPGDRGDGWWIDLSRRLRTLVEENGDLPDKRLALDAVQRVLARFPRDAAHPSGRAQIGIVELGGEGRERWQSFQIPLGRTIATLGPRPYLRPLAALLERGGVHPLLAVSAERTAGWIWEDGDLRHLPEWDAELEIVPGHERKAPAVHDPAHGQGPSSSGKDQFGQKLEANRQRFLHEAGRKVAAAAASGDWHEPLIIGESPYVEEAAEALTQPLDAHPIKGHNVINEPEGRLQERLDAAIAEIRRERERAAAERAVDAAMAPAGNGEVGVNATGTALAEARVDELVYDVDAAVGVEDLGPEAIAVADGWQGDDGVELMVTLAIETSAAITPVDDEAAAMLGEHGGVAALLRY